MLEERVLRSAAEDELSGARTFPGNAFKVELAKRAIIRAVIAASQEDQA
jgi:xanthine dehydrogenase YagS FAD-binding subunit